MPQTQELNHLEQRFDLPISFLDEENQDYFITIKRPNYTQTNEGSSIFLKILNDIAIVKKQYLIKEENELILFLVKNDFLNNILIEAKSKVINKFGQNIELFLEVHKDYEENYEELFIVIKAFMSPGEMLILLNELDEEWFLNIMDSTKGKLNITVEPL